MHFDFSEDQRLLQQTVREFLVGECDVDFVRAQWETDTGHSAEFWAKFVRSRRPRSAGLPRNTAASAWTKSIGVLLLEETGRAAVPGPGHRDCGGRGADDSRESGSEASRRERWLPGGRRRLGNHRGGSRTISPFVSDAHIADLLILRDGDALHAVERDAIDRRSPAVERSGASVVRSIALTPTDATRIAEGESARAISRRLQSIAVLSPAPRSNSESVSS